jgi:hypothetical protein
MAKISRFSFNCPHCKQELMSGWGEGSYASIPEQFNCPHCGGTIALDKYQKQSKEMDKINDEARQQATKGCLPILLCAVLLGFGVGYYWASNNYHVFDGQVWFGIIGIGLAVGLVLSGIITLIRLFIADSSIRKRERQKKG